MKKAIPIILVILAIGFFVFIIDPQYKEVQLLIEEKEDNDVMLDLAQELQRKRDILHESFNAISAEDRQQLEKLIPDTVDNVRLILAINNVAEQYGVVIRNIRVFREGAEGPDAPSNVVSSVDATGDIGTITLSFSIDATYDIFISFMKDLEEALRIVDIVELDINQIDSDDSGTFLRYSVTIDTYWLR